MAGSSRSTFPTTMDQPPSFTLEQLHELQHQFDLLTQVSLSLGMDKKKVRRSHFHVMEQISFVEKALEEQAIAASKYHSPRQSLDTFNQELSSEDETEELRHLFVSNGCAICLLDLKQPLSNASLPKVCTLKWYETHLVSVGLFGIRSKAFVIGGQKIPAHLQHSFLCTNCFPKDYEIYRYNHCSCYYNTNGTSLDMYDLFVDGGILRLDGTMSRTNKPKMWPIVELVDGFLHVFDSRPYEGFDPVSDRVFSHEFLKCDDFSSGWCEIPTSGGPMMHLIDASLVIGHCIYAVSGTRCLLFDSRKMKWEEHEPNLRRDLITDEFLTVWDILFNGPARCVLQIDSFYVVFALVSSSVVYWSPEDDNLTTVAMAYLVRLTGEIVSVQNLSLCGFFKGPMFPSDMNKGCVINGGKMGNVFCTIVNASGVCTEGEDKSSGGNYLFINTFTVREIYGAASTLELSWGVVSYGGEFVRIDVKDRYIFEMDEKGGDLPGFLSLQACFI